MAYITKQSQAVLHCFEQRSEESLTAAELAAELRRSGSSVGLATIYRHLDKLAASGHLHKINTAEGAFYHLCAHTDDSHRDCFLLKCSRCGRIRHLDCSHLHDFYQHLEQEHHFRIDPRQTLFAGICDVCTGEEAAHGTT